MYVFDQEIGSLLKDQKIKKFNTTPYEYFDSKFDYDTPVNDYRIKGTFLSISKMANFDNESITEICSFVQFGNICFHQLPNDSECLVGQFEPENGQRIRLLGQHLQLGRQQKIGQPKIQNHRRRQQQLFLQNRHAQHHRFGLSKRRQHESQFHKSQL